ncbi:glycoside hydrolase family 43 protein [Aspergillus tanneri]|uniref:Uncharacterized protein n=1 Tax=Aspergillus tanneri TaxID=1220188 RepID=A0A5M9MBN6_9EURO|nr:uncharacterized protein ATNIH1004_008666 [Aspergillus tanneri]KAA8644462.1 hypothetical protein ATNIH1004_008666 [Aspergillus tanneri]
MYKNIIVLTASLLALCQPSLALPRRVIDTDFPDPALLETKDGFYAFATTGNGVNAQIAFSKDFKKWELQRGKDALPGPFPSGSWIADHPALWAPDVVKLDDNSYVMYFSAAPKSSPRGHCVGVATSKSAMGPYIPKDKPLACPLDKGGAIDPSGVLDGNTRYVVYKIENMKLGTPIMLQELQSDGITPKGDPIQLIKRDDSDGPLIEAPSIAKGKDGTYYLTFSSHVFNTKGYDVKYATAPKVTGPYTRAKKELLKTGDPGTAGPLAGPGGSDFSEDGTKILFHVLRNGQDAKNGRALYAADVVLDEKKITVS